MAFNKNTNDIVFLDCKGNTLRIGSPVRYTGTGTTGFISDLMMEDCEMWARLDTTGLNYHASTLVLIESERVKAKGHYGKVEPAVHEILEEMNRKLLSDVTGADDRNIIGH
jgi:hypothetical protein